MAGIYYLVVIIAISFPGMVKRQYHATLAPDYINGLVQDCSNFSASALAMELLQPFAKPSI